MESLIVIIIVGCAVIYCGIGLKKVLTGKKQCSCSSSPDGCNGCSSSTKEGGCTIFDGMNSNGCNPKDTTKL